MEAVLTHSIALIGNSKRWATELQSVFGEQLQLIAYEPGDVMVSGHALYLIDIADLVGLGSERKLQLVSTGVLNASNLVILEEDRLLYAPNAAPAVAMNGLLQAIFKPKLPQIRNPLIPELWQQLMSEPVILACQRLCKRLPAETKREGFEHLFKTLKVNLHLIQETQEHLKNLLQQFSRHKVVSWEARQLLDSANALLMVQSLTALQQFSMQGAEQQEYGQLVLQTMTKFAEQLSAALFRYNEGLAFHWFFTEQKIRLTAAV
ncbi:MAG: hypothetical protein Q8J69_03135 [Sphingobacteriaceae bacterium]|nr:hypothetical protein [Sphingobacteriaceae bacterium]